MKENFEDHVYDTIKKRYRIGKIWKKLWYYVDKEYNYQPVEFFNFWPDFMSYYFEHDMDKLKTDSDIDEKRMKQLIDDFFIENQTNKKKRLLTKIL